MRTRIIFLYVTEQKQQAVFTEFELPSSYYFREEGDRNPSAYFDKEEGTTLSLQ